MKSSFSKTILALFIIFVIILLPKPIFSTEQNPEPSQSKNLIIDYSQGIITIHADNVPIADILLGISKETGIEFIYNENLLKDKTIFETAETPVRKAIKELLKSCGIKNYTIKSGEDKSIELVEILPELTPSKYTPPKEPIVKKEPELSFPKEEEYTPSEGEPIITHRRRHIPEEAEKPTEEQEISSEESGLEEKKPEEEEEPSTKEPITIEIRDANSEYYPPGSKRDSSQEQKPSYEGPLQDMSDQYHPPGYTPGESQTEREIPIYDEGPLPDMSDQYHPPGYKP